ncbi:MAG TPA: HAD family phosphatase [Vicinamibacterales bacterium]|nr:HAD family phosphatase [Vicinamibacterales bacterium]
MSVAAIVFDMDGLLIDTEPLYKEAWQRAARESGVELTDQMYSRFVGRSNVESEAEIAWLFGPAFPIHVFRARWPEIWQQRALESGLPTKPGVPELLDFVEERRVPAAVATSSDMAFTKFSLEAARLIDRFKYLVTGDEVEMGKPAPDIYLEAARRLGVDAADCVAFEDSEAGTIAASGAGMRVVLVPDIQSPSDAAREAATVVLTSLHDALPLLTSWLGR